MNIVLLKFQIFALKPNGWKFPVAKWTELVGYGLVVNVQKDACFGLSLTLICTIFKICSQFLKIAILRKS